MTHIVSDEGFPDVWYGVDGLPNAMWSACAHVGLLMIYTWTHWDLNPGPSACGADVIPLHHVPLEQSGWAR